MSLDTDDAMMTPSSSLVYKLPLTLLLSLSLICILQAHMIKIEQTLAAERR